MRNKYFLFALLSLLVSCVPRDNIFNKYLSGTHVTDIGVQGERARELFEGTIPESLPDKTVVFFTDATCSACIASVLLLYESYVLSGTDYSLIVLLEGSSRDLFDYYWDKAIAGDGSENVQIILSPKSLDLPKGFYVIDEEVVKSFSIWAEG